ncbi:MAG: dihydroorotase [Eubacteriales bacterium]|nr:dihydroorotase [Eubacteriales bacterium]
MKYLLKNGRVVNPGGESGMLDILVENGVVAGMGEALFAADAEVIDLSGCLVMPGLVDMHCHLREPGYEYKESIYTGTRAAAAGGFTAVACMPNTNPVCDSEAVVRYILDKAAAQGAVKVYPIASITKGLKGEELSEMGFLQRAGAVAFSDDGKPVENPRMMRLGLQYAKNFDALLISHCEDKALAAGGVMNEGIMSTKLGLGGISRVSEELMVAREILLAEALKTRVHIAHVSTRGSAELIRQAKARGVAVTAETCPHYFAATEEMVDGYDANTKVNPPLRTQDDRQAMLEALADGTLDAIATDHAPHHADEKLVEYNLAASGISGFETAFALSYTVLVKGGVLTQDELVRKMSVAPAQILRREGGVLAVGAPADIMAANVTEPYEIDVSHFQSKGKNNPFGGMTVCGRPVLTMVSGKTVWKNGEIVI